MPYMARMAMVLLLAVSACAPGVDDLFGTSGGTTTTAHHDAGQGAGGAGGSATTTTSTGSGGGAAPDTCHDGTANGGETGIDCGGPCAGCAVGHSCLVASDCESGVCGADGLCAAPACNDGVRNGQETDVDCGGTACDKCGDHGACVVGADCYSAACAPTTHECVCPLHKVVIAEVQTAGPHGQFVELWNASDSPWVPGDKMYLAADEIGDPSPHYVWASMDHGVGFTLPPWKRLLLVAPGWTGPTADAVMSSAIPHAGSIRLVFWSGVPTAHDKLCIYTNAAEEAALSAPGLASVCLGKHAYNPLDGRSLERGPGGSAGNCLYGITSAANGYVLSSESPQGISAPATW